MSAVRTQQLIKPLIGFAFMLSASLPAVAYETLEQSGFVEGVDNQLIRNIHLYSPQYPLWTDGAIKRRWIQLPADTVIDVSDEDHWVYPVGTKLWKEFALETDNSLVKIETRLLEKQATDKWLMETYVWSENQTEANLAPEAGIKAFAQLGNGKSYDIPSQKECTTCHTKAGVSSGPQTTPVLGFSAIHLSDNRDPDAIHGEALTHDMLTLSKLNEMGLLSEYVNPEVAIPASVERPLQRSVVGYLHGNCGHCHRDAGLGELLTTTQFDFKLSHNFFQQTHFFKSTFDKNISNILQPLNSPKKLVKPGDANDSALIYRMITENEKFTFDVPLWHHTAGLKKTIGVKMPFLGTNVIDQEAVSIISEYINGLDESIDDSTVSQ